MGNGVRNQARTNALQRVFWGVIWLLANFLVFPIVIVLSLVVMVIDVLWQMILGKPGLTYENPVADTFTWWAMNWSWVLFNSGTPRFWPPLGGFRFLAKPAVDRGPD